MHWFTDTNYDFIGKRRYAYIFSGIMVTLGIISLIIGPKYGIDFMGGIVLKVGFAKSVRVEDLRSTINEKFKGAEIQRVLSSSETKDFASVYTIKMLGKSTENIKIEMQNLLEKYGDSKIFYTNLVGPKVGGDLKESAIIAILLSWLSIIIYLWWRMDLKYGVAGVVALIHDVLAVIGIFMILGLFTDLDISMSIIAALLTVIGYSINDTIVVFSRMIEFRPKKSDFAGSLINMERLAELMNNSINRTLSRTINTALTTVLVLVVLLIFGGDSIRGFAVTLLFGIIFGTYSSIFVATPIVFAWDNAVYKRTMIGTEGAAKPIDRGPVSKVEEVEGVETDEGEVGVEEEATDEDKKAGSKYQKKKKRKGRN